MCDSLHHRGPDEDGFYETAEVSLSMRRLAIIDLKGGQQPISNETDDVWVVFNGEIYNYETLRHSLIERGHRFKTDSDTETIVHAYEEYGMDFVQYLRGMFAIALWDSERRRLVLARDRIGEKPLFFCEGHGRLYFGSEIKSILHAVPSQELNPQAVCDFMCMGYVVAPDTFYKGIRKLGPGEIAVYENAQLSIDQYWKFEANAPTETGPGSYRETCDLLDEVITESVQLCLKSDVEVAAFLSGGVDSSLIVALMKKLGADIQSFSVGYEGAAAGFNELQFAKAVSDHVGTRHHELILDAGSNIELLPRIIQHYDEPHGEPTSILVYLLCQFVQKHVKVALSGTGGDELFHGYPRHLGLRYLHLYNRLPRWVRESVIERITNRFPESTRGRNFLKRVKRFTSGAQSSSGSTYKSWVEMIEPQLRQELLSDSISSAAEYPLGDQFLKHMLMADDGTSLFDRVTNVDVTGYLPEYQLTYMDRMSMATSLEVRAPLCDFRVAEIAGALPVQHTLGRGRSKRVLKDVAKRYLPGSIVERKKVGFDSPIGQWFKDELNPFVNSFLAREQIQRSGILAADTVEEMVGEHCVGHRNYSLQLWSVVALEAWYRMYIEDNAFDAESYSLHDLRGAEGYQPKGTDRYA